MNRSFYNITKCTVIPLSKISNPFGNITVVQNCDPFQFHVKRIYYLYDVPGGSERGGHAHKNLHQLIIAASGSFNVIIDDGADQQIFQLNRPYYGLHIVPGIWRELNNFSSGAICLVLASEKYDPDDYIRNYSDFIKMKLDYHAGRS